MSDTTVGQHGPGPRDVPDQRGRFGDYGGRFVPETLTRALEELAIQYDAARQDAEFQQELQELLCHYVGRPSPLYFARRLSAAGGRGPDLAQTRGPEPHRLAQDQQHARPGAADDPHGQAPRDRRDGRRPARRGHGHGLCPLRVALRRLHGRRGYPPSGAQRVQHAVAGRRSAAGLQRFADAARRHQRGHARLDVQRREHALHPRLGGRPAPVSSHRARFPVGHRPRDAGAVPGAARRLARSGGGLRGRRQQRGRYVLSVRHGHRGAAAGRRGGWAQSISRAITPRRSAFGRTGCPARQLQLRACRTTTDRPATSIRVSAGLDYPGVGPEHSYWKDSGRVQYVSCRDDEALEAFDLLARCEGILPALESSHAVAKAMVQAATMKPDATAGHLPVRPRRQGRCRNRSAARPHRTRLTISDAGRPSRRS